MGAKKNAAPKSGAQSNHGIRVSDGLRVSCCRRRCCCDRLHRQSCGWGPRRGLRRRLKRVHRRYSRLTICLRHRSFWLSTKELFHRKIRHHRLRHRRACLLRRKALIASYLRRKKANGRRKVTDGCWIRRSSDHLRSELCGCMPGTKVNDRSRTNRALPHSADAVRSFRYAAPRSVPLRSGERLRRLHVPLQERAKELRRGFLRQSYVEHWFRRAVIRFFRCFVDSTWHHASLVPDC